MKRTKLIDIFFLLIFLLIIIVCFIKPIIRPVSINYAENRTANQIPSFTFSTFLDKTFQDQYEAAMADQIPYSAKLKKAEKLAEVITKLAFFQLSDDQFTHKMTADLYYIDNYLVYTTRDFSMIKEDLDHRIQNLNSIITQLNNVSVYAYYIEKDTDIKFDTNEKLNAYEYLVQELDQRYQTRKYAINDFNEFKEYFYKTDHHWNDKGSYRAYRDIVEWMKLGEAIPQPEEKCLNTTISGSKAASTGGSSILKEQLCVYPFTLKDHDIYINGEAKDRYGNHEDYMNNEKATGSYGDYYGFDDGLIEFDYHQDDKENLLMIGESYDNAINELLASHFNHTYNVDLRNYENQNKQAFDVVQFVKEHQIDKILLIGNVDYYVSDAFDLKGGD